MTGITGTTGLERAIESLGRADLAMISIGQATVACGVLATVSASDLTRVFPLPFALEYPIPR